MKGLMNVVFLLGIAFVSAFIIYMSYFSKVEIKEKIGIGVVRDVVDAIRSEVFLRTPLDSERSSALERALYFVGSFGGWYNPRGGIPNFTNPYPNLFPESRLYYWRIGNDLYVPSFENFSTSLISFYSGYFSYESLRNTFPKQWLMVYTRTYPIRPEMMVFYENIELGVKTPETKVYLVGSPLILPRRIGVSTGKVIFYPMITARSKAPLYSLYSFANRSVGDETLDKINDLLEDFLYWNNFINLKIPTVSYISDSSVYLLPKYDPTTYAIIILGNYLYRLGVSGFDEFEDPERLLINIGCYNSTPGGYVYYCLDGVYGKLNGAKKLYHRNSSCDTNTCLEKFWKVMSYFYYEGLKESGSAINDTYNNVYLRIIPYRYISQVEVYEKVS